MKYGISYRKTLGSNTGMRVAAMQFYGVPLLFDTSAAAREWATKQFGYANKKTSVPWSIVSEREATLLCKIYVEYFNGRNKDGKIDLTKLTYEQILPLLHKLEQGHKIQRRKEMRTSGKHYTNFPEESQ